MLFPLSVVFSVEGFYPEPSFKEISLDPARQTVTFPMDFEELFHTPYKNFLRNSYDNDRDYYHISLSERLNTSASIDLIRDEHDFSLNINHWKNSDVTKNSVDAKSLYIREVKDNPLYLAMFLSFDNSHYDFYKSNLLISTLLSRYLLTLDENCFDLRGGVKYLSHSRSSKSQEFMLDGSFKYQHLFSRYFGEDITIASSYIYIDGSDIIRHRKLSLNASFFYHRDIYLLKLGVNTAMSHKKNIGSPYIESRIDSHRLKLTLAYSSDLAIPEYSEIAKNNPEVKFEAHLPVMKERKISFEGVYKLNKNNLLRAQCSYANIDDYSFFANPAENDMKYFDITSADSRLFDVSLIYENRMKRLNNLIAANMKRYTLYKEKLYLPYIPLFEITDTLHIDLDKKWQLSTVLGFRDGIRNNLYWYTDSDPDYKASMLFNLGISYRFEKFSLCLNFENIAGMVYDYMGYKHPFGVSLRLTGDN